jgi:hypothetical protein
MANGPLPADRVGQCRSKYRLGALSSSSHRENGSAHLLIALLSGFAPLVESQLQSAPALTGGLTTATWVIWGLGGALLLLLGAGLHLLIAIWRRRSSRSSPPLAS